MKMQNCEKVIKIKKYFEKNEILFCELVTIDNFLAYK